MKIVIQLISIYRALAALLFVLFYNIFPNSIDSFIISSALCSDLLDGYLAKKYNLTSTGGKLLDLFSDKYLNCIFIIFLIINKYPLIPLIIILTKEIFVLSFRSIQIDGEFVISTNRLLGGIFSFLLFSIVLLDINSVNPLYLKYSIIILGALNIVYLLFKIKNNWSKIKKSFYS